MFKKLHRIFWSGQQSGRSNGPCLIFDVLNIGSSIDMMIREASESGDFDTVLLQVRIKVFRVSKPAEGKYLPPGLYGILRFSNFAHGEIMSFGAMVAILVCMVMTLIRASLGPTVFDRVLAVNAFGTKTVLLIAVLGFLTERPAFLDLALVYALMNFIGTIAVMKFTRFGDLAGMESDGEPDSKGEVV